MPGFLVSRAHQRHAAFAKLSRLCTTNMPSRRHFLAAASAALGAAGLGTTGAGCRAESDATGAVDRDRRYEWIMVTTWPPGFPILHEACELIAAWVRDMSAGQLTIKVYGAGELIPAFECFEAVSLGTAAIASGASYYWAGKVPEAQFFSALPFGLNAQGMNAWIAHGGGLELWRECYAPFNITPYPAGNTGVQMAGWFRRELTDVASLRGLKMRIPGLGGKVFARAGGTTLLSPGTELYTNLERGVIDATEWIGPYHDYLMGFHEVAPYYYGPGWHEPGTVLEVIVHSPTLRALPPHLRAIVESAIARANDWTLQAFEAKNGPYLERIRAYGTQVRPLPTALVAALRPLAEEVVAELAASSTLAGRIYESYTAFAKTYRPWQAISERAYAGLG